MPFRIISLLDIRKLPVVACGEEVGTDAAVEAAVGLAVTMVQLYESLGGGMG